MDTSLFLVLGIGGPLVAAVFAIALMVRVNRADAGTDVMRSIAERIRKGAMAFLRIEYSILSAFVLIMFIVLAVFLPAGSSGSLA